MIDTIVLKLIILLVGLTDEKDFKKVKYKFENTNKNNNVLLYNITIYLIKIKIQGKEKKFCARIEIAFVFFQCVHYNTRYKINNLYFVFVFLPFIINEFCKYAEGADSNGFNKTDKKFLFGWRYVL